MFIYFIAQGWSMTAEGMRWCFEDRRRRSDQPVRSTSSQPAPDSWVPGAAQHRLWALLVGRRNQDMATVRDLESRRAGFLTRMRSTSVSDMPFRRIIGSTSVRM